jgi:putative ABC transport system substrate-binding protein
MTRRTIGLLVIFALSFLATPFVATAQPRANVPRIGWLAFGFPPPDASLQRLSFFLQGLRELGWVEGQNIIVEFRWARGQTSQLSPLAAELVQLPVDVIVVADTPAIEVVTQATTTIPIVMLSVSDPLRWESIASLARPGGNVTGVGGMVRESREKLLELLKEAVPGVTRVAILTEDSRGLEAMRRAARSLGVSMYPLFVGKPDQFEPAFKEAIRAGAGALVVMPSVVFSQHQRHIAALALQHGLPAIYWSQRFAEVGGLMAYGPSLPHLWQRVAAHVDKILKGAKPADLPVEQPMAFAFVINLKTAQALGLTIPATLLFQADEVIR